MTGADMNSPSRYLVALLLLQLSLGSVYAQQAGQRPRIGLTLSGGGAKGLAHIGILKAIDSAGLKIDYITGTSMGSIIGSLYAIGYSADTIEKIARKFGTSASAIRVTNLVDNSSMSVGDKLIIPTHLRG